MAVKMQQLESRQAWLEARMDHIGGSDASAVIGRNPYKSNVELWQEKTGLIIPEDISEKPYVKYGHDAEPLLRELFKIDFPEYRVDYVDNNFWTNSKYPFAHASLDGWLTDQRGRKGILEIKTTNILHSMQKEKWNDRIPDNYYVQVLHYLGVTEFEFVILKAQLKTEFSNGEIRIQTKHYYIERSEVEEEIEYLFRQETAFYGYIKAKIQPALILPEI